MQLSGNECYGPPPHPIFENDSNPYLIRYRQMFDLEGETGLVVRGIGTAVTLVKSHCDGVAVSLKESQHERE